MVLNSDDSLSSCLTSMPNRHHTPSPPSSWYECLLILMWYVWKYPGFKEMHSITPTCLPSGFAAVILSLLPKQTNLEMCYTWFWVSQCYFWLGKDSSLYIFYKRSDAARITDDDLVYDRSLSMIQSPCQFMWGNRLHISNSLKTNSSSFKMYL